MRRILVIILLLAASCGNDDRKGPVDIHYGQDICERCKMIISEEKFSSQVIMDKPQVVGHPCTSFFIVEGITQFKRLVKIVYGGIKLLLNLIPEPQRSRTFGTLTSMSPSPV